MKNLNILLGFLATGLMTSCGGGKGNENEKVSGNEIMTPETTTISGGLEDCFVVVDKEYKITDDGDFSKLLTVELQRTEDELPFELTPSTNLESFYTSMADPFIKVGFGIEFLDDDGNVLGKVSASATGMSTSYSPDEAIDIVKLRPGEKGCIRFSVDETEQQATKFRISSAYAEEAGWNASSNTSTV